MANLLKSEGEAYTEDEAARSLGISLDRLHFLLDEHVFNDGSQRPRTMNFRAADLVLLAFWDRATPNPKVLRMPRRN